MRQSGGQLDTTTAARVIDEVLTADFAVLFVSHDVALADRVEHRFQPIASELVPR